MESLLSTRYTQNEKQGNGQYKGLRRRKVRKSISKKLNARKDLTMQFNTSRDPIYFAFEYLEERTVGQLMNDFVQDTFFEITSFISKISK